ncbi:MAG TPA: nitroreductase family protein [Methanoregulaceae archaeon]|nr:nitroreductase family protein [Methanoregulaceae archaeon]
MTIKSRRSVRKYRPTTIPPHVIADVLDCGRLAPTAKNVQPWLFGAVTDPGLLREIADLTDHGKFIADAALCIAVFGRIGETYYLEDCCAATMSMIIALQNHGYGTCWVAGDKKPYAEPVRELLNVPPEFTLVSLISVGAPAEVISPPKKRLEECSFKDRYTDRMGEWRRDGSAWRPPDGSGGLTNSYIS